MIVEAPALAGMSRKWLYSTADDKRALEIAITCARGVETWLPVIYGGRVLAWLRGRRGRTEVEVLRCAVNGLDQMINAATTLGQRLSQQYTKIAVTGLAALGWYDYYTVGPGGGTFTGTALTARRFTDLTTGAIPHGGNVSPAVKIITGAWGMAYNMGVCFLLYDRVLTYEACTISGGLQNMTNTLTAQRYISAGQPGLGILCTIQTQLNISPNISALKYTNQAGTTGQSVATAAALTLNSAAATPDNTTPARCAAQYAASTSNDVLFYPLAVGDSGAQKIESFTTSAAATGTICFTLAHPFAYFPSPGAALAGQYDFVRQLTVLERIYDGACLNFFVNATANNNATIMGALDFVWA